MINKINKITCTFENPDLEKRYFDDKWIKVSSFYFKVIIFFIFASSMYLISLIIRDMIALKSVINPIIFITFPLFLILKSDEFKKKYLEKFLLFLPIVNNPLFFYLDYERLSNLPHIAFIPLFNAVIWISIFPFNFIYAFFACTVPFIASLFLLTNYDTLNIPLMITLYFFPYFLLISGKWKSERDSRINFSKSITIEQNRQLMHETLKRYFGVTLSDKIIEQEGELEGENKWVTILFADLSAYSTITENMSPEVALEFLNEYFTKMHEVIKEFDGHTLNYIGDSVMVVFGAPEKLKSHENQAVKCSLKMREQLSELNREWDDNETSRYWKNHGINSITMRIGIHTGSVIAGNVGSKEMLQYSTIGDTVNVAARLEQANKEYNTEISFSHEIYTALTKELYEKANLSGEIILKGRTSPTKVYSIT
jgi:class 3 adenylate cyclase